MTYTEYKSIPAVNWSSLKHLGTSPLQYQHELTTERADSSFFRVGLAIHAMILEPAAVSASFQVWRERRGTNAYKAFAIEHYGKTILSGDEWDSALGAAAAIRLHPYASALLAAGLKEAALQWTDAETGLPMKARVDHAGRCLIDLKSAARIDPRMFANTATRLGYPQQFAFYEDGLRANGIEPRDAPHMVVVQSGAPHDAIVYRMQPDVIEHGRYEYKRLLRELKRCRETYGPDARWPGVAPEPIDFVLPAWIGADEDDDLDYGETEQDEGEAA